MPLSVVTFAPAVSNVAEIAVEEYPLANETSLADVLAEIGWDASDENLYRMTLSAIESLSSIRKSRSKREAAKSASRCQALSASKTRL